MGRPRKADKVVRLVCHVKPETLAYLAEKGSGLTEPLRATRLASIVLDRFVSKKTQADGSSR